MGECLHAGERGPYGTNGYKNTSSTAFWKSTAACLKTTFAASVSGVRKA